MCEFISAVKVKEDYFYLTKDGLKGKKFKEYKEYNSNWREDIMGHGAILYFYPELKSKGEHWGCTDFSSSKNFPDCIVEDIKLGKFEGIGVCLDILNKEGMKKYKKIRQSAWNEYEKIKQSAWNEYEKIKQKIFLKIAKQRKYRNREWK